MNSSQENTNSKSFSESNKQFNINSNPNSFNQSFHGSKKSEEQDQFLLDNMSENASYPLAWEKVRAQSNSNNFFNEVKFQRSVHQSFPPIIPELNQPLVSKPQHIKQKISRFDEDLQQLMRLTEKPQEKISFSKAPTQKEERNRKTMSRLSHQFFTKNGTSTSQSNVKSKVKSRRTISGFGFELGTKNNDQSRKINEEVIQSQKNLNQLSRKDVLNQNQVQKMEIQQVVQSCKEQQKMTLQKQNISSSRNQVSFQQRKDQGEVRKTVETRLSEVKRQRDRLSMGRDNLINFIKTMDEQEKKKEVKVENQRRKVTIDMFQLVKLISEGNQEQKKGIEKEKKSLQIKQNPQGKKQLLPEMKESTSTSSKQQKPKRYTQFMRPVVQLQQVILEDQRQDEFTPLKSLVNSEPNSYMKNQFLYSSKLPAQKESVKKIDYQKEVFKSFFQQVKDKVAQQRKVVQNLRRQKQQVTKTNKQALSQFRIDSRKLNEIKQEQHAVRTKIAQLKTKINNNDYLEYRKVINEFQLKFGIKLHNYQKIIKGSGKNIQAEGFFTEFTYENMLFRVKRNQRQQTYALKFQPYTTLKNEDLFTFKFDYQLRTQLYQLYITKRLKKTQSFLTFMVNFLAYAKALSQFQLTMEYKTHLYNTDNLQLHEASLELQFQLLIFGKFPFMCKVDLLKLRENGGISIRGIENKIMNIPEEVLRWRPEGNKIQQCLDFLEEYSIEIQCKEIDDEVEIESSRIR